MLDDLRSAGNEEAGETLASLGPDCPPRRVRVVLRAAVRRAMRREIDARRRAFAGRRALVPVPVLADGGAMEFPDPGAFDPGDAAAAAEEHPPGPPGGRHVRSIRRPPLDVLRRLAARFVDDNPEGVQAEAIAAEVGLPPSDPEVTRLLSSDWFYRDASGDFHLTPAGRQAIG